MKQGFNFLKPQVEAPSSWTYIYEWIVGTARAILIVFEIAVVIALFLRVIVDVQSKTLDIQIQTLEDVMATRESEEQKYRLIQTKTKSYATLWTTGEIYSEAFNIANQYIPASAVEFDVSLDRDKISIKGQAIRTEIDLMERGLKESNLFSKVTLDVIETESEEQEGMEIYMGDNFTFTCILEEIRFRTLFDPSMDLTNNVNL